MNLDLKNKIVLLTGGTGEIGKQICLDFIQEDARVICLYRNEEKFKLLKNWIDEKKGNSEQVFGYKCDLLNKDMLQKTVSEIETEFKRIDVLVNCAGQAAEYPFAMMEERHLHDMIDQNFLTVMLVTQSVLKTMFRQKSGAIVNISSVASSKAGRGIVVYASAKSAVDTFTRTLAQEVGKKNIRVNAIRPGAVKTPMSKALEDRASQKLNDQIILGRIGTPEEISKAVLFLSSEKTSSYITGTTLDIDGGLMY
ncbi:MAG: SDR family oxidoreductase [Crocinitomicaceae bacterium]|nr:SDR family oxidoreductase [Crocinitomicaceae bacterium]